MTLVDHPGTPATEAESATAADLRFREAEAVLRAQADRTRELQHANGRSSARERLDLLLDPGSFVELDAFSRTRFPALRGRAERCYGDAVITGHGTVGGRPVCVFSQDATFMGGSLGEVHAERIIKIMELAMKIGCPLVGINDGAGARIQEGVVSQALYAEIFRRNVRASGMIPQISLIMGHCAGGAAYSPALTDFVVMVDRTSHMFITGPEVIRTVTGEAIDIEELGGGRTHGVQSGNAHYVAADDHDAIAYVQELLSFLPSNYLAEPPHLPVAVDAAREAEACRLLDSVVPESPARPYDMTDVLTAVLDDGRFLEVHAPFAPNILVGFGRVDGGSVGVVASQPMRLAGCIDIDAAEKAARFVRTCNAYNLPVLTFVDVPGFLPGVEQEWNGIIRRGAKLIYAYAEATVPMVTVITRKAYGAGYDVLGSKHLGADINLAWPTAEIAVMGAPGATGILHRRRLATVQADGGDVEALRARLEQDYGEEFCNPYLAAERGYVDAVIPPSATRAHVSGALRLLREKRVAPVQKKIGNVPM